MVRQFKLAFFAGLLALGSVSLAQAQSDASVYDATIDRVADVCPGHSKERTEPVVRAAPVAALRKLASQGFVMCPDRRLDAEAPVVWYGMAGVYAWNPDVEGAGETLLGRIEVMTRTEDFPAQTLAWNLAGKELREQLVPAFEARPGAFLGAKW